MKIEFMVNFSVRAAWASWSSFICLRHSPSGGGASMPTYRARPEHRAG